MSPKLSGEPCCAKDVTLKIVAHARPASTQQERNGRAARNFLISRARALRWIASTTGIDVRTGNSFRFSGRGRRATQLWRGNQNGQLRAICILNKKHGLVVSSVVGDRDQASGRMTGWRWL